VSAKVVTKGRGWEYARQHVASGDLRAGDMEALPYDRSVFDVVTGKAIQTSGEARVREAVVNALVHFTRASGGYRMENEFRLLLAAAEGRLFPRRVSGSP